MAAIHDLIAQIGDARLRERLAAEWAKATRERKFGLVFEDRLPELLPLPQSLPRKGDLRKLLLIDKSAQLDVLFDGVM
jgi:adenine-specific DNA-methyltransferase